MAQLQKRIMEVKADYDEGKDLNMRAKAALTAATIPHKTEQLSITNEQKKADIEQSTVDMAHSLKQLVTEKPGADNAK